MSIMKQLRRWDYESHTYKPYEIPAIWNTPLYSEDMKEVINCASCGDVLTLGKSYTSLEIRNSYGLGFPVCMKCFNEEMERWNRYRGE